MKAAREKALRTWNALREEAVKYGKEALQCREDSRVANEWLSRSSAQGVVSLDQEARLTREECARDTFVSLMQPHVVLAACLSSASDLRLIRKQLHDLVLRHGALRTGLHPSENTESGQHSPPLIRPGEPRHRLFCTNVIDAASVPITEIDVDTTDSSPVAPIIFAAIRGEAIKPFQLTQPPLMRAIVVKNLNGERFLAIVADRLVADWWLVETALASLTSVNRSMSHSSAPDTQDSIPRGKRALRHMCLTSLEYLREQWSHIVPLTAYDLPWTLPATVLDTSIDCKALHVPQKMTSNLKRGCNAVHEHLSTVVLAAVILTLRHASQKSSVSIWTEFGTPWLSDCASVLAPPSHMHIVTVDLTEILSRRSLLRQVRESLSRSRSHSHVPTELVWRAMTGSPRRWPTVGHVSFQYSRCDVSVRSGRAGIEATAFETSQRFALQFWAWENGDDLSLTLAYDTSKYDEDAIETLMTDVLIILEKWSSLDDTCESVDGDALWNTSGICEGDPSDCYVCRSRGSRRWKRQDAKATWTTAGTDLAQVPELALGEARSSC